MRGLECFSEPGAGTLDLSGACRDPKDGKFPSCAVEGRAHCLVSSDRDLLDMRRYRDVCIVNPGQFLLGLQLYELPPEEIAAHFAPQTLHDILNMIYAGPDDRSQAEASAFNLREM